MKAIHSVFAACIAATALPASAGPFTSTITDTATISVQGTGIQMTRLGSEYTTSGVGVKSTTGIGAVTTPNGTITVSATPTTITPTSDSGTFQFSESFRAADTVDQSQTISATGEIGTTNLYGQATMQYAGTAGGNGLASGGNVADRTGITMPLVSTTTGPTTVTSTVGGPVITVASDASGITAQAQRSISLTVFD